MEHVNVGRLGASVLYQPPWDEGSDLSPTVNIVFVHGLRGHPLNTWSYKTKYDDLAKAAASHVDLEHGVRQGKRSIFSKIGSKLRSSKSGDEVQTAPENDKKDTTKNVFWPAEILPSKLPRARILTYGYNADVVGGLFQANNKNSILQHGNDLMVKLERALKDKDPIIFVAHSLGGLVVKVALQRMITNLDPKYQIFFERVHSVLFCGTPHRGSDAAAWGHLASNIVAAAFLDSHSKILADLEVDSQILDLIHDDFIKLLHRHALQIHSFQEGRPLTGIKGLSGKVVDDFSSKVGWGPEQVESIDASHIDMVKSAGVRDISDVLWDHAQKLKNSHVEDEHIEPYLYVGRFHVTDYQENLFRVSKRHPKTCTWISENGAFKKWKSGEGPKTFWLHGYPGLGKSVIAKYVLEILTENRRHASHQEHSGTLQSPLVVYFFCSDREEGTRSLRHLLCSIIHQLIFSNPRLAAPISEKWPTVGDEVTLSVGNLWLAFSLVLSAIGSRPLYIIIDALDEMSKDFWARFFEDMDKIMTSGEYHVRLFVTSRNEPEIEMQLLSWHTSHVELGEISQNRLDVSAFLEDSVLTYGRENSFGNNIANTVLRELAKRADGMFLWATLAWDHFRDGVGLWTKAILDEKVRQLQLLPPGLDALYHRILQSTDRRLHAELWQVLKWVACSKQPLTIEELSVALALSEKPRRSRDIDARMSLKDFLKKRCPHLIKVDNTDRVNLVHLSFKDFLLQVTEIRAPEVNHMVPNYFHLNTRKVDYEIGMDCLVYLSLDDFYSLSTSTWIKDNRWVSDPELWGWRFNDDVTSQFVFITYARTFWTDHLESQDDPEEVWIWFKRAFDCPPQYRPLLQINSNPLFFLCKANAWGLMKHMIDEGYDINAPGQSGDHLLHRYALSTVSASLDRATVDHLVTLGAHINGRDALGRTIMHRLALEGWVVELREWLRRPGVDINSRDNSGQTIIHIAARSERSVAKTLFDLLFSFPEIDINIQDSVGNTPLTLAIHWANEYSAARLLSHPEIDINSSRSRGESPLLNAVCQGWTQSVLSLLGNLANVDNFCDSTGRTILHWTIMMGMIEAFKIALSKQSAILNLADDRGMTALHYASQEGEFEAVGVLLKHNCTITKTRFGESPLHLAAARGHQRILELLLTSKNVPRAILNEKDNMGWTITHRAVTSGNDNLIEFLLAQEDLELTRKDRHGRSAVAFAAAYASKNILKMFLSKRRQDETFVDSFGNTLIHLAAGADNAGTLFYLLELGSIDKNRLNHWGKTALDLVPSSSSLLDALPTWGLKHSGRYLSEKDTEKLLARLNRRNNTGTFDMHEEWKVTPLDFYPDSGITPHLDAVLS